MKTLKFIVLLLAFTVLASCAQMSSSVIAPSGIDSNDHEALVKHYENLAEEAKIRLHENKKVLEAYEARPYYYGRQALDLPSHATANIRAYEETLKETRKYADLHRKMAMEQQGNPKSAVIADRDLTAENSEFDEDKEL